MFCHGWTVTSCIVVRIVWQCETGLTRPSRLPTVVISCNHYRLCVLIHLILHSAARRLLVSVSHFSLCSFSCNYRPRPACTVSLPRTVASLSFFPSALFIYQTFSSPLAAILSPSWPSFHSSFSSISFPTLPTPRSPPRSLGSHVTSLKLSPINQQYLGGSVSILLCDWLLHSHAVHTHIHTADPLCTSFRNKCDPSH